MGMIIRVEDHIRCIDSQKRVRKMVMKKVTLLVSLPLNIYHNISLGIQEAELKLKELCGQKPRIGLSSSIIFSSNTDGFFL